MISIISANYIVNKPIENAMRKFATLFSDKQQVLDIGCGTKPYKHFFNCQYIGLDPIPDVNPDFIAVAWKLPFKNESFDGIILNQSLEHIARPEDSIQEIHRVLKPGGKVIVTTPMTMKSHSLAIPSSKAPLSNFNSAKEPYWREDYFRFTKFGLIHLFRKFNVIDIQPTTGYFGTILQLCNYFFASLTNSRLLAPIYFTNNLLAISSDNIASFLAELPGSFPKKFKHFAYDTLTINYIMTLNKPR